MKMKEICQKTGLTERTIRFYTDKKLINPASHEMNGRIYRDYSEEEEHRLSLISSLRKLGFSIEEIFTMLNEPTQLPALLQAYRNRIQQQQENQTDILNAINPLDFSEIKNAEQFISYLQIAFEKLSLPKSDIEPNYTKFEDISEEEKQLAYQTFLKKLDRKTKRHHFWVWCIPLLCLLVILSWIFLSIHFYYQSCYQSVMNNVLLLTNYETWEPTDVTENALGFAEPNATEYIYNDNGGQIVQIGEHTVTLYELIGSSGLGYQKIYQDHVLKEIWIEDPLGELKAYFNPLSWFGTVSYDPFIQYSVRTDDECDQMAEWLEQKDYDKITSNGGTIVETTKGTEFIQ
jgi:DNA-binding transcriptional MerR regulator